MWFESVAVGRREASNSPFKFLAVSAASNSPEKLRTFRPVRDAARKWVERPREVPEVSRSQLFKCGNIAERSRRGSLVRVSC